ncbi:hypothetical protein PENTCL1PPCAC_24118 [Pristionchus entomophagus]|uniref:RRM domain-containing protein n=1 Tax=Pristionchus entomophagus TaxID=358040 RepID=A0AAV5U739_9BILA|nr:hypothetical protein PENTCL1PPCAC_24118 [Pristionchus entomophagus]
MSVEEEYRRGLEASLRQVHEMTTDSEFPGGQLVNKMNELLLAASDTDFGVGCSEPLTALYQTISRVGPEMIERSEDLPLLFFARSFAVVMEKTVRQPQQTPRHDTVSLPYLEDGASSGGDTPHEDQLIWKEEGEISDLHMALTPPPTDSRSCSSHSLHSSDECRPSLSPPAPPAETRLNWRALSPADICGSPRVATAVEDDTRLYGTEAWRQAMQRQRPDRVLDFSFAAIRGRVNIFCITRNVREADVRALLEPFGPIVDFSFHPPKWNHDGFALAQLESRRMVTEAIAALDGTLMDGTKISVKRAMYHVRPANERPLQQLVEQQRSCSQQDAAPAAAAAPVAAAVDNGRDRDSDDESDENSMYSVD